MPDVTRKLSAKLQGRPNLAEQVFDQVRDLAASSGAMGLFPNGLESLELELELVTVGRISLRLKSSPAVVPPAASGIDDRVMLLGDVEATFNAEGHHVVAIIATTDLEERSPDAMKKVKKIVDESGRPLLQAATFPDDIRAQQPQTKPFHFVDIVLEAGGPTQPPLPPEPHVISKIAEYTTILTRRGSSKALIDPLSWLIHLIGDIHQPLHCVTHVTSNHPRPDGDRGGNSFALRGSARNLHALWDSSVSFSAESEDQVATSIMTDHPRGDLAADLRETNVEAWARASFSLAKQYAYGPLNENPSSPPKPSAAYLATALKVGQRQAALAGYRLSDRLAQIFK